MELIQTVILQAQPYDQLPKNVYKCKFAMTNDLQPQQVYYIAFQNGLLHEKTLLYFHGL